MELRGQRGSIYLGVAGGLFAISGALVGAYFVLGGDARADAPRGAIPARASGSASASAGAGASGRGATVADPKDLAHQVAGLLDQTVDVQIADQVVTMRWSDLGVVVDDKEIEAAARRAASDEPIGSLASAGALPLTIDRDKAIAALTALKGKHDRAAVDARLDLEAREIRAEQPGFGIDVYASLPRIEAAARQSAAKLELAGVALPAHVTRDGLGISDISHVLGHWETKFSVSDKDRNFNLKLAASKLNGHVIPAGADFSFNDVVGDRTEKEGYRIAHVIQAGEMVDGLAGGTCQISTTLFAASFFAGLDITETHNHSRPSVYQPVGFDSTVVYPSADLKLHNSFDFPIVIHYIVANGEAKVEILGKERPYDRVVFERHILEDTPYTTEERQDSTLPNGSQIDDQPGFDGYKLIRYRRYFKGDQEVKTDKWTITYKPVVHYVRKGTNPDTTLPPPKQPDIHMPPIPTGASSHLEQ